jgi:hypothetical protein
MLHAFGTSIDQPQSMHFSGGKSEIGDASIVFARRLVACSSSRTVEIVSSLDEVIVREWCL